MLGGFLDFSHQQYHKVRLPKEVVTFYEVRNPLLQESIMRISIIPLLKDGIVMSQC